jgi:DNA-binding MarR family transcriptional regulator
VTDLSARVSETDCAGLSSPGRLLRRAEGLVTSLIERRLDCSGLSFRQWVAVNVICNGTGVTPSDLARELGITSGAITRLVDELEGRGLIQRRRSGNDRRVIHLTITPLGDEAVAASRGLVADVWRLILSAIDERERRHLATAPATLVTAAETLHTEMEITE